MTLYHKDGGPVKAGDKVVSFRGEIYYVASDIGEPPRHAASTGRIYVVTNKRKLSGPSMAYFPSVFDTGWRDV
jgi:hypothetical protein